MLKYIDTPQKYVDKKLADLKQEYKFLRIVYYTLNVLTGILSAASSIVVALVVSKLLWDSFPDWFFFMTAAVSSFSAFAAGLINFFVIKDNMKKKEKQILDIESEKWLYEAKAAGRYKGDRKDFMFFLKVANIAENDKAREVYNYERDKQDL